MAQDKNYLKQRFARTGAEPTADDFANLIDAIPDDYNVDEVAGQAADRLKSDTEFIAEVSPKTTNSLENPSEDTILTTKGTKDALQEVQNDYNEKIGVVSAQASTAIVGVAETATIPVDTTGIFRKYSVKTAGVYSNFPDINGAPIEVISDDPVNGIEGDLSKGIVELWGKDGVWTKNIQPISLVAYAKNGGYVGTLKTLDEDKLGGNDLEIIGENLFVGAIISTDKYVDNGGNLNTTSGWKAATITIDASKGQLTIGGVLLQDTGTHKYYTINSNPKVYGLFDTMPKTIALPGDATEISFSVKRSDEPDSVLNGIVVQYGAAISKYGVSKIKGNAIYNPGYNVAEADKTFAAKTTLQPYLNNIKIEQTNTTNLVNPDANTLNSLLNTLNGSIVPLDTYNVTDFIPLKRNTIYTVLNLDSPLRGYRNLVFFNASKGFVSSIDSPGFAKSFTSPDEDGYFVRISLPSATNSTTPTDPINVGLFEGSAPTWEYYNNATIKLANRIATAAKTDDSVATIKDVKVLASGSDDNNGQPTVDFSITESGTLTVIYPEGTLSALVRNQRGNKGNDMLNFYSYVLAGQESNPNPTDDVAPTHEQNTTIGANHGVVLGQFTAAAHGLTNADRGSAWTKGANTYYLMLVVNVNTLLFLGENRGTVESPSFAPLSTGDYTRVSDGSVLTLSNYITAQLYPTIKNLQSRILANGINEVGNSGIGTANFIDVVESYDIKLTASMLQNVINTPGGGDLTFDGDISTSIRNTYRFLPNMATLVISEYRKITPTIFSDWMVAQSNCTIGTISNTYYYIPNSNPLNASVDLRKPTIVPWSTSLPSTFVINDSQPDPDNPPNRVVMYNNNLGYMIGYLPKRGIAKALNNYTHATFELRNNTGKVYPHAVDSVRTSGTLPANATFNVVMMRVYCDLTKTRSGNRLSIFNFNFEGVEYVFVDYSGSMYDRFGLGKDILNGKSIEVVESSNAELLSDTYQDGITVNATYVEGQTCYMILMIK